MGVDKALMKINGMTLLEIAVQNLENSGVESIHVLVKDGSQADIYRNRLGERVSFHLDPPDTKGPWEALVAMLQQLNDKEIVQLLPVDTPWFDDIAIDLLQEKMKHTPESVGVLPINDHGSHPLLSRFRSGKILQVMLSQPPESLRSLFNKIEFSPIYTDDFRHAGCHPNCLLNLNHPEDFSK